MLTNSEIQKEVVRMRWRKEEERFPLPFNIPEDCWTYPHNHECELYPGYFYIPWVSSRVVVNHYGHMMRLKDNSFQRVHVSTKGYLNVSLRVGEEYKTFAVHRIVAMLFCEHPKRHQDLPLSELEVNHKDHNKVNNHYKNLEWVTKVENIVDSWENGYVKTEVPVLGMNVNTGYVSRYPSISECGRTHELPIQALSAHLNSQYAGMIEADEHRFKFDNDQNWPDDYAYQTYGVRIGMNCDVIAQHVDGRRYLFNSIANACDHLRLPKTLVRLHRTRKGTDVPFDGWVFSSLTGLPLSKKLKGQS